MQILQRNMQELQARLSAMEARLAAASGELTEARGLQHETTARFAGGRTCVLVCGAKLLHVMSIAC